MNRFFAYCAALLACVFLFGCAHPITMTPDLSALSATGGKQVIDKQVGYYMPDALRSQEVTTPGGGGDKVRYFPYRDIEPGFYKALSEAFRGVTKIVDPKDVAAVKSSGISLLITPEIRTSSSSSSAFTWPPTEFTVNLVCAITDPSGKPVETIKVTGEGRAEFAEFKSNFSLAAVRATNDALSKLIKALNDSSVLRK